MINLKKSLSAAYQTASSLAVLASHRLLRRPKPRYEGSLHMKGLSGAAWKCYATAGAFHTSMLKTRQT